MRVDDEKAVKQIKERTCSCGFVAVIQMNELTDCRNCSDRDNCEFNHKVSKKNPCYWCLNCKKHFKAFNREMVIFS
jgi:hypothetical protein